MALVWIGLAAALLVTVVSCGVMLARKFVALLQALADFVSLPSVLDGVHRADAEPRPAPAVLRPRAEVAAERVARRARALQRRQARHSKRLARGRAIVAVDVTARDWFSS
jgi:hypothetical protein